MSEFVKKMPDRLRLGKQHTTTLLFPIQRRKEAKNPVNQLNEHGYRTVMGFNLPSWQRPVVWSETQMISFIESAWLGINLGTFTYNSAGIASPNDNLLIDGQQRLTALERYFDDEFPVFEWKWSQLHKVEHRRFTMTTVFPSYETETEDEEFLKSYYNLMNFSGTAHTEDQRA